MDSDILFMPLFSRNRTTEQWMILGKNDTQRIKKTINDANVDDGSFTYIQIWISLALCVDG